MEATKQIAMMDDENFDDFETPLLSPRSIEAAEQIGMMDDENFSDNETPFISPQSVMSRVSVLKIFNF